MLDAGLASRILNSVTSATLLFNLKYVNLFQVNDACSHGSDLGVTSKSHPLINQSFMLVDIGMRVSAVSD